MHPVRIPRYLPKNGIQEGGAGWRDCLKRIKLMSKDITHQYSSFNPWFLVPFIFWLVLGGIAQLFFDNRILFEVVNTHHTPSLDILMVYITRMGEGVFGAIILMILLALRSFRNWWYFSAAMLCNVIPAL